MLRLTRQEVDQYSTEMKGTILFQNMHFVTTQDSLGLFAASRIIHILMQTRHPYVDTECYICAL